MATKPPPWKLRLHGLENSRFRLLRSIGRTLEWFCAWPVYWWATFAWTRLVALVATGVATIWVIFAAFKYTTSGGQRKKQQIYQAWEVINSAVGITGSGGRRQALEDLRALGARLDGVDVAGASLSMVDLDSASLRKGSMGSAFLDSALFRYASSEDVDYSRSDLSQADFLGAHLQHADFRGAQASRAMFEGADLTGARFELAAPLRSIKEGLLLDNFASALGQALSSNPRMPLDSLWRNFLAHVPAGALAPPLSAVQTEAVNADFSGARLDSARLVGAVLVFSEFRHATLRHANVAKAWLSYADLRGASLDSLANWQQIGSVSGTNIHGIKGAPKGFRDWALKHGAVEMPTDSAWNRFRRQASYGIVEKVDQQAMPRVTYYVHPNCEPLKRLDPNWKPATGEPTCAEELPEEIPALLRPHKSRSPSTSENGVRDGG